VSSSVGFNLRASAFVVASALCASLASLIASFLVAECGYYSPLDLLLAIGLVGSTLSTLWWSGEPHSTGLLGSRHRRGALLLRGVSGCVANAAAWVAFSKLSIAVANTIMFTSPFFVVSFAYLFLGQSWQRRDTVTSVLCFSGVLLVADPAAVLPNWGLPAAEPWLQCLHEPRFDPQPIHLNDRDVDIVGGLAALGFSLATAAASVVINSHLHDESTATITFWPFACISIIAWPSPILSPGILSFGFARGSPTWPLALLALLNFGFQWLRVRGFQLANDSSVSSMLYTEIVFSFVLGRSLLRQPVRYTSILGAVLVIMGASTNACMKREELASPATLL